MATLEPNQDAAVQLIRAHCAALRPKAVSLTEGELAQLQEFQKPDQ